MPLPKISVVVPNYNSGATLERTILSLLAQDYPADKLRVTVVDDCSTDDSYEHAARIALTSRGRIRVSKNPRNIGKRHSIIRATRESSAEIISNEGFSVVAPIKRMVPRST